MTNEFMIDDERMSNYNKLYKITVDNDNNKSTSI